MFPRKADPPQFRLREAVRALALYGSNIFTRGNTPKQYKISYGVKIIELSAELFSCVNLSLDKLNRPLYKSNPTDREIQSHKTRCRDEARLWARRAEEVYIKLKSHWELLLGEPSMANRREPVFRLESDVGSNLGGWLKSLG